MIRLVAALVYQVRFEDGPLDNYLQYIDPALLKTALLQSVYYLRDQPPLFNLFLGVVLKVFPGHSTAAFQAIYLGLGLSLAVSMYLVMVRLRVPPAFAAVVTIAFTASPTTLLYENWLFYTYPLAALLSVTTLVLHRFLERRRFRSALAFFSLLALIVLTRGIFHLLWQLAIVALLIFFCRRDRAMLARAAAGPLALVFAFYLKTYLVFGGLVSGQMYQQVNLATMTLDRLPAADRKKLEALGKVSHATATMVGDQTRLHDYEKYIPHRAKTGIPLLDQEKKSNGFTNWQHQSIPDIAALYGKDGAYVLWHYPQLYLASLRGNLIVYFRSSSYAYPFIRASKNGSRLRALTALHDRSFGPVVGREMRPGLLLGIPAAIGFGALVVIRWLRRGRPEADAARALTTLFMLFNVLYVSAVTLLFSSGDHNRYRYKIAPFFCVLLAMLACALWDRRGALLRRKSPSARSP